MTQILRAGRGVKVCFDGGDSQTFDEVVLATHADTSLEVGINLVAQNEYDAIILDLMLPRRDGLSMCRELRQKSLFRLGSLPELQGLDA